MSTSARAVCSGSESAGVTPASPSRAKTAAVIGTLEAVWVRTLYGFEA